MDKRQNKKCTDEVIGGDGSEILSIQGQILEGDAFAVGLAR